jgi:hypothetical protein
MRVFSGLTASASEPFIRMAFNPTSSGFLMKIHLITVVGVHHALLLEQMLQHYVALGISSFLIHAHSRSENEAGLEDLQSVADRFGVAVKSVSHGDHADAQRTAWKTRQESPDDWFLIVDVDEFQVYPAPLLEIIEDCDRRGYDHIKGCFLDRVAIDGTLTRLSPELPLWGQYPMGLFLTYPILRADPRKVVAAKGHVDMANNGHHVALSDRGCPINEYFIPVHHFKWFDGVLEALERRIAFVRRTSASEHWRESQRFIDYYRKECRIDVNDPAFLGGLCAPDYPHWNRVRELFLEQGFV